MQKVRDRYRYVRSEDTARVSLWKDSERALFFSTGLKRFTGRPGQRAFLVNLSRAEDRHAKV